MCLAFHWLIIFSIKVNPLILSKIKGKMYKVYTNKNIVLYCKYKISWIFQIIPIEIFCILVFSHFYKISIQLYHLAFFIPLPTKLRWDIVTLPTVRACVRPSLREYGSLLIFKVKGQGHRVKFLQCNILVNTLESTSFNGFWPNFVILSPYKSLEPYWFSRS